LDEPSGRRGIFVDADVNKRWRVDRADELKKFF
jgi:hypothetical protein